MEPWVIVVVMVLLVVVALAIIAAGRKNGWWVKLTGPAGMGVQGGSSGPGVPLGGVEIKDVKAGRDVDAQGRSVTAERVDADRDARFRAEGGPVDPKG